MDYTLRLPDLMSNHGVNKTSELVAAARSGDRVAMDALMRLHLPSLRAFVRSQLPEPLRRRESESDVVQTVCRAAVLDLDQFTWRGDGSFRAWLGRIALNKIRGKQDHHLAKKRDPRRERVEVDDENLAEVYRTVSTPSQHAVARELVEHMESAIGDLPEQQREIFLMLNVLGMTRAEVAEETNRSEEAVRVAGNRALARLTILIQARSGGA